MLCVCIARIRLVIHVNNKENSTDFLVEPDFLLAHRNRYLEGMDSGQKNPPEHPNWYSHVKNLHVLVFRTDGQTDGQTDRDINPV
jgi:hypothetical protein